MDHQGRTCLQVSRSKEAVRYIPLAVQEGLRVVVSAVKLFDQRYKPLEAYPAERAAKLYVRYALELGATKEVMTELGKVVKVTPEELNKATMIDVLVKQEDGTRTTKTVERGGTGKVKGESASQRFQDLLMEGGRTDDQIFDLVAKQFKLDPSRRSYVGWYRKKLIKDGKNPPEAK